MHDRSIDSISGMYTYRAISKSRNKKRTISKLNLDHQHLALLIHCKHHTMSQDTITQVLLTKKRNMQSQPLPLRHYCSFHVAHTLVPILEDHGGPDPDEPISMEYLNLNNDFGA